ncbi:hypothetical protein EMGBS15_16280 [Filimonas sp.]|jgi:hypothetical protein|nr:hypothetical protein EMGBS15_16280 [Filimonas sp.]
MVKIDRLDAGDFHIPQQEENKYKKENSKNEKSQRIKSQKRSTKFEAQKILNNQIPKSKTGSCIPNIEHLTSNIDFLTSGICN